MENLKALYNEKLQRAKKYCELSQNEQDKHEKRFMELLGQMDQLIIGMDIDCVDYKHQLLNGFEV